MNQLCEQTMEYKELTIEGKDLDVLLGKEWLISNSRGSYSAGTVIGCNTRRYHGLLIASLRPPVERIVTVGNLLESVEIDGQSYDISSFEFADCIHPQGYYFLKKFRSDSGVHFCFQLGQVSLEKSIYLSYDKDQVVVSYKFSGLGGQNARLTVSPMVVLRDFHAMQNSATNLNVRYSNDIVTVHHLDPRGPAVHMTMPGGYFEQNSNWWYSVKYRVDSYRGQQDFEDICVVGSFSRLISGDGEISLVVSASSGADCTDDMNITSDQVRQQREQRIEALYQAAKARDDQEKMLVQAADQFVVRRVITGSQYSSSILAGYPWFADWGRDTFIALPGILLSTGRFEEAKEVLDTFGSVIDGGQIPNRFDDYGNPPHYNSIDASLWFVNAVWQYLQATGDLKIFRVKYRPMLKEIIEAYSRGTRDNIHADVDGLITGGDKDTQLTWMDAKCNGIAFTPRFGKAVEINALWYNALRIMAETASSDVEVRHYDELARKVSDSFEMAFWNQQTNCLYDFIYPDGTPDAAIRPNQILAVSLPFTCLSADKAESVVNVVRDQLLTPYGLRSLSPLDSRYRPWYGGDQFSRDSAYHQGTVWGWLIGPFIEAFLKVNKYSEFAVRQAREYIEPVLEHARSGACIGSISEIFDANYPHYAKGCFAQAWSVGEALRILKLINYYDKK